MSSHIHISDEELTQRLLLDDRVAFEEMYHRYWKILLDAAFRRSNNLEQSKDMVQDIFIDLWNRRGKVKIENLHAYLITAVKFQVYKLASKNKINSSFYELFDSITTTQFSPDSKVFEKELEGIFNDWLSCLPTKRKQIFQLFYKENLSTREIADRLHISQKTVQNQLGTATHDLQDKVIISTLLLFTIQQVMK